jgi:transglutaminase-like putative cysteine protease
VTRLTLALLAVVTVTVAAALPAGAADGGPILHEPLPPDSSEDFAMHAAIDGQLPPAIRNGKTSIAAPDPRQPPMADEATYAGVDRASFNPDRDTRRPDVGSYDDPFTPSTAPFKRLSAFDAVREDYTLYVRDERTAPVLFGGEAPADDDVFYADEVVELTPGRATRIPSVGPGARILRARLGVGADEISFLIQRDGADNWSLKTPALRTVRARLVMELAIARATFGGAFADSSWAALPLVPPLPDGVARDAAVVRRVIGVSRQMSPRAAVTKLVDYFRAFAETGEPLRRQASVYLDLALSKKGVCRHRAFAFLVTAQSLGVPTRMVTNEAHAWVEVHDGALWRRIDLGGAGEARLAANRDSRRMAYEPLPDAFRWPAGVKRGSEMFGGALQAGGGGDPGAGRSSGAASGVAYDDSAPESPSSAAGSRSAGTGAGTGDERGDSPERVASSVTLDVVDADARRGEPLHVRGSVAADGEPCAHTTVELLLREAKGRQEIPLGALATDANGAFSGGIVVPVSATLGDYDVIARTPGSGHCGPGASVAQ